MSHAFFIKHLRSVMHRGISNTIKEEIQHLLPVVREEVEREFIRWHDYTPGSWFYSDEKVLEVLPYAAYEYILLCWGLEPHRITMPSVIRSLNEKLFADLRHIIAHALRRIALQQKLAEK